MNIYIYIYMIYLKSDCVYCTCKLQRPVALMSRSKAACSSTLNTLQLFWPSARNICSSKDTCTVCNTRGSD